MDSRLIAWARSVKRHELPPLWFFTDSLRAPDPLAVIARLPPGLCGVVFRHDDAPSRLTLGKQVARLCRARRLALVVAGDPRLAAALGAGLHLRGGRQTGWIRPPGLRTASVHNAVQAVRARRAGVDAVFISPVFLTASHPGAEVLGSRGWHRLACLVRPITPFALGGINGATIRALGRSCAGAGAIEALFSVTPQAAENGVPKVIHKPI
ncbi:thiamine phosphate synthase [Acidocella aromatica]|uniref:Thiamine-phosphate pyrophosphorylase n=1 Tax=Acidocella aromatica TaxID=1303579 RepID=A0A840VG56_9PROT|nr:thiamine phosphate synthase [Acidocella aromatica]MBB5373877.1 thiamine-phosphate pyrophosphorylase [Acidocella aromatica]